MVMAILFGCLLLVNILFFATDMVTKREPKPDYKWITCHIPVEQLRTMQELIEGGRVAGVPVTIEVPVNRYEVYAPSVWDCMKMWVWRKL